MYVVIKKRIYEIALIEFVRKYHKIVLHDYAEHLSLQCVLVSSFHFLFQYLKLYVIPSSLSLSANLEDLPGNYRIISSNAPI